MNETDKHKGTLYITHSGELLCWLIIILLGISIFTVSYFTKNRIINDYHIYMPDVDGLIVGSPVRMMGIEVGHVTKIKPINNELYVTFVITDKMVSIPIGTEATVEFSGMAGSKSLELYLPNNGSYIDKNTQILTVNPPKRLHDALGLLNDMFAKLDSIINTTSNFVEKVKLEDLPKPKDSDLKNFLEYTDTLIDESNRKAEDFGRKVNNYEK